MILKSNELSVYTASEQAFASGFSSTEYACVHSTASNEVSRIKTDYKSGFGDDFWINFKTFDFNGVGAENFQNYDIYEDFIPKLEVSSLFDNSFSILDFFLNLQTGIVGQTYGVVGLSHPSFKYEMFGAIPVSYTIEGSSKDPYIKTKSVFAGFKCIMDPAKIVPDLVDPDISYLKSDDVSVIFNGSGIRVDRFNISFDLDYDSYFYRGGVMILPKRKNVSISFYLYDYDSDYYSLLGKQGNLSLVIGLKTLSFSNVRLKALKRPFVSSDGSYIQQGIRVDCEKTVVNLV